MTAGSSNVVPFVDPREPSARAPYYYCEARDTRLAALLAEEMAGLHLTEVADQRFDDLAGLKPGLRAGFIAAAGAALRSLRKPWRDYARKRAIDRAVEDAEIYLSQYFTVPSAVDPTVRVKVSPEKLRSLLAVLVNDVLVTYQGALDGSVPMSPGDAQRVYDAERELA